MTVPSNLDSTATGSLGDPQPGRQHSQAIAACLVALLLAAFWAIDLALAAYLHRHTETWQHGHLTHMVFGFVFGQISLISGGLVWIRRNITVRVVVALLWIAGISWLGGNYDETSQVAIWFGAVLLLVALYLLVFVAARLAGWQIGLHPGPPTPGPTSSGDPATRLASVVAIPRRSRPWGRFTIWTLLSVTTAVAVVLAAAKYADFPLRVIFWEGGGWVFGTLIGTSVCTAGLILIPKYERPGPLVAALLIFLALVAVGSVVPQLLVKGFAGQPIIYSTNALVNAAAAVVLRIAGLRLAKPIRG